MSEVSTFLLSLLSGIIGAAIGGALSWRIVSRQEQLKLLYDLHREFNTREMVQVRYEASELLQKHPNVNFTELRKKVGRLAVQDVWTVVFFYQRLWLALEQKAIPTNPVLPLFGDIFIWWYDHHYLDQLVPLQSEPARHIERLAAWMKEQATPEQLETWKKSD